MHITGQRLCNIGNKAQNGRGRPSKYSATCATTNSPEPHPSEPVVTESWTPDDTTFACLRHLRRPDLHGFKELLHPSHDQSSSQYLPPCLAVGGMMVQETGPLAGFSTVLDAAARRVLPGHLLRRCRILSSVQLGDTCLQRVALTACSGEESVFEWRLKLLPWTTTREAAASLSRSHNDNFLSGDYFHPSPARETNNRVSMSDWRLCSISRDESADADDLPSGPHPRASPEVMIMAQLSALRRGDVAGAAKFNMKYNSKGSSGDLQLSAYRAFLREKATHHLLLTHSEAKIVASAGPSPRTFVAEVLLQPHALAVDQRGSSWLTGPGDGMSDGQQSAGGRFLFELGRQTGGWRVEAVRALSM